MLKKILISLLFLSFTNTLFAGDKPQVRMTTNMGIIELELDREKAPLTVENFLQYVKDDFYSGTIFHRVIKRFMIQGGGFTQNLERKQTREPVANEAFNGLKNNHGTIAMARTPDPHSATSQFFINTVHNNSLNFTRKSMNGWGYTVFGKVTKGIEVVNAIEDTSTGAKGVFSRDVPQKDIIIQKIEIISE